MHLTPTLPRALAVLLILATVSCRGPSIQTARTELTFSEPAQVEYISKKVASELFHPAIEGMIGGKNLKPGSKSAIGEEMATQYFNTRDLPKTLGVKPELMDESGIEFDYDPMVGIPKGAKDRIHKTRLCYDNLVKSFRIDGSVIEPTIKGTPKTLSEHLYGSQLVTPKRDPLDGTYKDDEDHKYELTKPPMNISGKVVEVHYGMMKVLGDEELPYVSSILIKDPVKTIPTSDVSLAVGFGALDPVTTGQQGTFMSMITVVKANPWGRRWAYGSGVGAGTGKDVVQWVDHPSIKKNRETPWEAHLRRWSVAFGLTFGDSSDQNIKDPALFLGLGFDVAPEFTLIAGYSLYSIDDIPNSTQGAIFIGVAFDSRIMTALTANPGSFTQ